MKRRCLAILLGLALFLTAFDVIPERVAWKTVEAFTEEENAAEAAMIMETPEPTAVPTPEPTAAPTPETTTVPTPELTAAPTPEPTAVPTPEPTAAPTPEPTAVPMTESAVAAISEVTVETTVEVTVEPTVEVTVEPTVEPTVEVTVEPTVEVTVEPTVEVTVEPTVEVTAEPTLTPEASVAPEASVEPTEIPEETIAPEATMEPEASAEPTVSPEPTAEPEALGVSVTTEQRYARANAIPIEAKIHIVGGTPVYSANVQVLKGEGVAYETTLSANEVGDLEFGYLPTQYGTHQIAVTVTDANGQVAAGSVSMPVAASDSSNRTKWEKKLADVKLSGDWREDLLAVARTQIGYEESHIDFIIDADGDMQGYTLYGDWYGATYQEWCAMFASWCLKQAGVDSADFPRENKCRDWKKLLTDLNAYESDARSYAPAPGDLVFFNWKSEDVPQHVGIVEKVEDGVLHTIEGNSGRKVARREYDLHDTRIIGYANTETLMLRVGVLATATPEPVVTDEPEATLEPVETDEPEATVEPVETDEPEATVEPVETEEPEVTVEPVETDEPEATPEPVETEEPEVTATPEPTDGRESTYYCNLEEHVHGMDCFDDAGELICLRPAHAHTADCEIKPSPMPTATSEAEPSAEPSVEPSAEPSETPAPVYGCGLEVHTHGEGCFDETGALVCELAEHVHDEGCIVVEPSVEPSIEPSVEPSETPAPVYGCGLEVHTHGEGCFDETGALVCELAEHVHDESCIVTEPSVEPSVEPSETPAPVYGCGLEAHMHGEGCFDETGALVCELAEHVHDESCIVVEPSVEPSETPAPVYGCGLEAHTHGEGCFDETGALVCELAEHVHDEGCIVIETFAVTLTAKTPEVPSGDQRQPVTVNAAIAAGTAPYTLQIQAMLDGATVAQAQVELVDTAEYDFTLVPEEFGAYIVKAEAVDANGETASAELAVAVAMVQEESAEEWEATFSGVRLTGDPRTDIIAIARTQLGYAESTTNFILDDEGKAQGYTRYGAWYGAPYEEWCAMFASFCLHYAQVDGVSRHGNCARWIESLRESGLWRASGGYRPMSGDLIFFDHNGDGVADHVGLVEDFAATDDGSAMTIATIEGNVSKQVQRRSYALTDSGILGFGQVGANAEQDRIDDVVQRIAALPDNAQIEAQLAGLDDDAYEAYMEELILHATTAYAHWEDLGPVRQKFVTNADKLLVDLSWLLASTYWTEPTDTVLVQQVNHYSQAVPTVVSGDTVRNVFAAELGSFAPWDALVIEADEEGLLYVDQIIAGAENADKRDLKAKTEYGFVLLVYGRTLDVQVGDSVYPDFNYRSAASYSTEGAGLIRFYIREVKRAYTNLPKATSAPTRDLIEVNLYDYGTNINDPYNNDKKMPGFQQDGGTTGSYSTLSQYGMNFGNNITSDLAAGKSGVTVSGGSGINASAKENTANVPISGAMSKNLGADGYPALADGTSLKYLFSDGTYAKKQNSQSIDGLFQYNDTTGAYTFNSRTNHAQFNRGSDTFTLYKALMTSNYIMYPFGNFLPFNDIVNQTTRASEITKQTFVNMANNAKTKYNNGKGAEYNTLNTRLSQYISNMDKTFGENGWDGLTAVNKYFELSGIPKTFTKTDIANVYSINYDEPTDFFFGMEMKMKFIQPRNGLTGKTGTEPMVFYFTGDDDVWVYVDGKLFLDLSGIHRHVGGEIDFVNGKVYYYSLDKATGDVSTTPYKTVTFEEILGSSDKLNDKGTFKNYTSHTLNFYYMERGAGSGVCRMNFNFPLLKENMIAVSKELSTQDGSQLEALGNPDFSFQILKANTENELFVGEGASYALYDGDMVSGKLLGTYTVGANGVFSIKAGQTAVFSGIKENAGQYFVRELFPTDVADQYGEVTVSGSSETIDANDVVVGETTFKGVNSPVYDIGAGTTVFMFDNAVDTSKFGSLQIQKALQRVDENDTSETPEFSFEVTLDGAKLPVGTKYTVGGTTKTVEEEGVVKLRAGETLTINGILAGTKYEVRELDLPDYQKVSLSNATGAVPAAKPVVLEAENREMGTKVNIPISKTVSNPDGREHRYEIELVQLDADGKRLPDTAQQRTVVVTDKEVKDAFTLSYVSARLVTGENLFTYEVYEPGNVQTEGYTDFDSTVYTVQVRVVKAEDGTLTASAQILKSDQTEVDAAFINTLRLRNLTVEKEVRASDTPEKDSFGFVLKLESPGLNHTYTGKIGEKPVSVEFTDGKAEVSFKLRHGEKFVLEGLPDGTTWTVTEEARDDYWTKIFVGKTEISGNEASGKLDADAAVKFVNNLYYALPETGGGGFWTYITGGVCLMAAALLMYIKTRKGRRRSARI